MGGGAFLKEWEVCKRPWPEFSLFLNKFHTVCPKIETEFLGKLWSSNVFSAQKQVVSKKEKGLRRNWVWFFGQNRKFKRFFSPKTGGLLKKKKKKVFAEIESDFLTKIAYSNTFSHRITTSTSRLRHPISFGRGCFQFFTKNQPKSNKNVRFCILHKPMGGLEPPPPPPLATLLPTAYMLLQWKKYMQNL